MTYIDGNYGYDPYSMGSYPTSPYYSSGMPGPGYSPMFSGSYGPPPVARPPEQPKKEGFNLGKFLGNTLNGIVSPIKDMFTDPKKLLLGALAVGACFIPGVGPVIATGLVAWGAANTAITGVNFAQEAIGGAIDGDWERVNRSGELLGNTITSAGLTYLGARANMANATKIAAARGVELPTNVVGANLRAAWEIPGYTRAGIMTGNPAAVNIPVRVNGAVQNRWIVPNRGVSPQAFHQGVQGAVQGANGQPINIGQLQGVGHYPPTAQIGPMARFNGFMNNGGMGQYIPWRAPQPQPANPTPNAGAQPTSQPPSIGTRIQHFWNGKQANGQPWGQGPAGIRNFQMPQNLGQYYGPLASYTAGSSDIYYDYPPQGSFA